MVDAHDPWASGPAAPPLPWARWVDRAEPGMWALVVAMAACLLAAALGVSSLVRQPDPTLADASLRVGAPLGVLAVALTVYGGLWVARARRAWALAAPHVPPRGEPVRMLRVGPLLWVSTVILVSPAVLVLLATAGWLPLAVIWWTPQLALILGGVVLPAGVLGWDGALARLRPEADHADRLAFEARWAGVVSWSAHTSWLVGAGRTDEAGRILALFHSRSRLLPPPLLIPLGEWCLAVGRPHRAVAVFDAARTLMPRNPRALAGWAHARLAADRSDPDVLAALDDAAVLAGGWRWRWNRPGWTAVLAATRAWALALDGRRDGAGLAVAAVRQGLEDLPRIARTNAAARIARAEAVLDAARAASV